MDIKTYPNFYHVDILIIKRFWIEK